MDDTKPKAHRDRLRRLVEVGAPAVGMALTDVYQQTGSVPTVLVTAACLACLAVAAGIVTARRSR